MKFEDKVFLGAQIRYHRRKAGLTQEKLAEKVNLSTQHISRIESGCYIPSLTSFFMLISVLNIDLRIFGYNVNPVNHPVKDKLIEKVASATDAELIFYENLLEAASLSLNKVKKELL